MASGREAELPPQRRAIERLGRAWAATSPEMSIVLLRTVTRSCGIPALAAWSRARLGIGQEIRGQAQHPALGEAHGATHGQRPRRDR